MADRLVEVVYENHRGEVGNRRITPLHVWFGTTQWEADRTPQWLLHVYCHDRKAYRDFAMARIREWRPVL